MRLSQVVRSGPGQYLCQTGALDFLAAKLQHFQQPCIIAGEKSLAAFQRAMPETLALPALRYDGSASREDMRRLATAAAGADVLIGIGGGRALDTAKGTTELLNVEYITLPTVLVTCAATTPLSAVYWPDHAFRSGGLLPPFRLSDPGGFGIADYLAARLFSWRHRRHAGEVV